jgi:hypothetical protein
VCNLYSMTTNVEAIRRLFGVDAADDRAGNLPSMPGIYPDYPAPIVRNDATGRELTMARWGMPSSQKALKDATKRRADKLQVKGGTLAVPIGSVGSDPITDASSRSRRFLNTTRSREKRRRFGSPRTRHVPCSALPDFGPSGPAFGRRKKARSPPTSLPS